MIRARMFVMSFLAVLLTAAGARAQAVGGADGAQPVPGDRGVSSMVVVDQPEFRVQRDFVEPGAIRRLHSHDDATYHVFVLITGQVVLNIEGNRQVEVAPGQVVALNGGTKHAFKNTGRVTATIVEVFGKTTRRGDEALGAAAAAAFAASPRGR